MTEYQTTNTPLAFTETNPAISALIEYLNPEISLMKFERFLKGEVIDTDKSTSKFAVYKKEPEFRKMNDKGVNQVMAMLHSIANPNTILGRKDEKAISRNIRALTKELSLLFSEKWKEYEIDPSERHTLAMMILRFADSCYRRAMDESDKELLARLFRSTESIQNVVHDKSKDARRIDPFNFFKPRE